MPNSDYEALWEALIGHQGETFHTVKGLEFQYLISGGELFVSRKAKSITRATINKALDKIRNSPDPITEPKALGVFGAPYIWAIFTELRIIDY